MTRLPSLPRTRSLACTALVLPLLLLTACSGGGDEGDGGKAAYLAEAEAVCTKANDAQAAATVPAAPDAIPAYVRQVVTIAGDASAELDALEAPQADEAELEEKFLAPLREQVGLGEAYATKVEQTAAQGVDAAVLGLLGSAPLETKADLAFLEEYGFTACVAAADTSS